MNNDNSNFNFNMKDLESLLPSNLIPDVVNENNLWHQKINANSNLNNRFDSDNYNFNLDFNSNLFIQPVNRNTQQSKKSNSHQNFNYFQMQNLKQNLQQNNVNYLYNNFNMEMGPSQNLLKQNLLNQNKNLMGSSNGYQGNYMNTSNTNSSFSTLSSNINFVNPKRQTASQNCYKLLNDNEILQGRNFLGAQNIIQEAQRSKNSNQSLENFMSNVKQVGSKKNSSNGYANSNFKNNNNHHQNSKNNNNKRKNSSNQNVKKEDEDETLESFIDNLDQELHVFICSQKGSRIMQKFLNKIAPESLNYFLHKLGSNISLLMTDLYGNYFCQKLAQSCSAEQRICKFIVNISYDNSGTHALQSLLEIINLQEEEAIILNSIKDYALEMCFDNNATHVIQKILMCISEEKRDFLNKIILDNLKSLSVDCNGICVFKKFVNHCKSMDIKNQILEVITNSCLEIVQSPFGNYAIQHLIEEWGMSTCKEIINVIQTNIVSLSMQKYSSNVIEKSFELADKEFKKTLINELMNPVKIPALLKNKYGNFVLQKAVNYLTPEEKVETKKYLQSKINLTSTKEKSRINNFLMNFDY